MRFSTVSYQIDPGAEAEIEAVLTDTDLAALFRSPTGDPAPAGPVHAAAGFVQDDTLTLTFEHDGEFSAVARHLATEPRLRSVFEGLTKHRVGGGTGDVLSSLSEGEMLCIQQRAIEWRPDAQISALRYRVKPGHAGDIAAFFQRVQAEARPTLRDGAGREIGVILVVALFVHGSNMIRVVQHDGELEDVAQYMAKRPARPEMEKALEPYMAEHRDVSTPEKFLAGFRKASMRRLFNHAVSRPGVANPA